MGLKSIEMQVALPRTQDAGKMQEQLTRQGELVQQTLTEKQLREEQLKRKKVNQFDNVEKRNIDEDDEHQSSRDGHEYNEQNKHNRKKENERLDHPYLGKHIDYSG